MTTVWKEVMDLLKHLSINELPDLNEYDKEGLKEGIVKEFIDKGVMQMVDPAHVMLVEFHGERLIRFVASMLTQDQLVWNMNVKIPNLEDLWKQGHSSYSHRTCYSADYLEVIWKFAKKIDKPVTMEFSTSYPLIADVGENIRFILAPRMEE